LTYEYVRITGLAATGRTPADRTHSLGPSAANLRVKEVRIAEDERFVICYNPEAAERDAAVRAQMLARLDEMIKDSGKLTKTKRAELRGVISTKPGLNRYLRDSSPRPERDLLAKLKIPHPKKIIEAAPASP